MPRPSKRLWHCENPDCPERRIQKRKPYEPGQRVRTSTGMGTVRTIACEVCEEPMVFDGERVLEPLRG